MAILGVLMFVLMGNSLGFFGTLYFNSVGVVDFLKVILLSDNPKFCLDPFCVES